MELGFTPFFFEGVGSVVKKFYIYYISVILYFIIILYFDKYY